MGLLLSPGIDMRQYRDAIASIESAGSGDYAAIGPTHDRLGRALGRYQIMESNIGPWSRAALGREVSPDEFLANPALQDQIFDHQFGGYIEKFGPVGAAEAWFAGPGGVGKTDRKDVLGTTVGDYGRKFSAALGMPSTVSTKSPSGGLLSAPTQEAPMEQETAGGLLGRLFPGMGADRADELRLAINGMLHNPNQGRDAVIRARMGERAQGRKDAKAQAQAAQQANRTIAFIEAQVRGGKLPPSFLEVARVDPASAFRAASEVLTRGPEPRYRQVTGQEAAALGLDPSRVYNIGPDNKVSGIGGGDTNINIPGNETPPDATLRTELQKNQADTLTTFAEAGAKAASNMGDLQALRQLSALAPSGPITGRLAQQFPDFNDVAAVRQSIVKRVAPQLRVEGSGSTSDIEYAGMIEGLGNLANTPEANMAIADMMIAKAEIDMQRADLISQYQNGQLDYSALNAGLAELNRKSIMPESLRSIIDGAQSGDATDIPTYNPETGRWE